ncbi:MAG: response regulator [Bacteroidetes bacterium HGW-Bacteroidetes-10]|jgi:DNA-binding NtrC family response regulator|nr:MAG: response regulator [Bacteroidetes bacterium HGW-Bacteroidetes-10]
MSNEKKIKLFLVDDDPLYLKMLEIELGSKNEFIIESFPTGELCLQNLHKKPDVIVLDYFLDNFDKSAMNGIQVLDEIKSGNPEISVVILSSQDKIDVAVNCIHHKAFDYIVKSETAFIRLKKAIAVITHIKKTEKALNWYMEVTSK